ncbi:O-antigen ligase family protein [Algoriphagus sp. H41]|uniref:O-antigen ligase family protein n=1 Tax=Algoriphagus oliviformis TaxID=2811231 RepID=A0ABS3BXV8_9BACT|nr:O-antigen ligase family protein [Algoriphagus oliviformis]MBN7809689.1 O-antigen ligase family protein [Algoriphagus oliviformis]
MALIFFIAIALTVGIGFLWVMQEMVFKRRWSWFVFFLAAFLPFYITSLSVVFLATGSPEVLGIFQVLKEVVVLVAVLVFIFYQRKIFDYPLRLQSTDWLMLALLALAFLYLLLPLGETSFIGKALYFKAMLIPGLVYFLGRNTQFDEEEVGWFFRIVFLVAIGAFVVNCIEHFVLGAHLQQFSGYALYNQVINDIEPSGHFGLTWTFETQAVTKRLAGFFSDPLELASSVLMGFAAGLIWFLTSKREYGWPYLLVMGCSLGSLVFSSSRAAFGAFFIMLFFVALVFRLYKLIGLGFAVLLAFVGYVLLFASEDFYYFVLDTLTFESDSSAGHVVEWLLALDSMFANPLGIGLAMSGNFGSVSDELRVGGENQFLIYGVQLGWLGMLLYIFLLASGVKNSVSVFHDTEKLGVARIAFTGAVVKVGLLLPLFTANVEIYTYVSWISWWMIGVAVNEYSLLKKTENKLDDPS